MKSVDGVTGKILTPINRPLEELWKGFTHFQNGDVIFAKITPCMENGKIAIAADLTGGIACGSTEFHVLRSNVTLDPYYLWCFLRQKSFRAAAEGSMTGAVGHRRVPKSYLEQTQLPLPPLAEQKRIVATLESLSAKAARARDDLTKIDTLVTRYKQAVLQKAFRQETTPLKRLKDLAKFVTSGSRGWAKYYSTSGPMFLRIGNTRRGSVALDLSDVQSVVPPEGAEGNRTRVHPGDVLVSITADLGRIGVVPIAFGEAYVNQHIALIRLNLPEQAKYLAWYLVSPQGQAALHENDRGAIKAGLSLNDIRNVMLPMPSADDQKKVVRWIEASFRKIECLHKEAKRALKLVERLDEALLAKAFKGELVPQDPEDEPASVLLDRIRAEREATAKPKKKAKAKPS